MKNVRWLEALIREMPARDFLEATRAIISRRVKLTGRCYVTSERIDGQRCLYCSQCPAGRWWGVQLRSKS